MSDQPQKTLRVAAVQMECVVGGKTHNLGRATGFIEEAVARGAELVLLPELMPGGYTLTEALWGTVEPRYHETDWKVFLSQKNHEKYH